MHVKFSARGRKSEEVSRRGNVWKRAGLHERAEEREGRGDR